MMPLIKTFALCVVLTLCGGIVSSHAQEPEETPTQEPAAEVTPEQVPEEDPAETVTSRQLLDAIRQDLVDLKFEKALAALEPLLISPALSDDERIEAMVLRSQTRAAFGDLKATEEDYRQILLRRPNWSPDPSLTPAKALKRFEVVRDKLIGRVRFVLDPADATLVIDGGEVADTLDPIALLAGTHEIHAGRRGHDPIVQTISVAAGESVDLEIGLIPNARTVILRTDPEDVEVWLDGVLAGRTSHTESIVGLASEVAELVIEDVPLGEHRFEFRKECRRTEHVVDALNVDLLDRAPKRYETVRMAESYVLLTPRGGPAGTEFRIDGAPVATLPAEDIEACPGQRDLAAVYEGRVLWSERRELIEGVPQDLRIRARPNLALVGLTGLPRELAGLQEHVNLRVVGLGEDAAGDAAYDQVSAWRGLSLARGTDLALAPAAGARQGMAQAWWLYSPILNTVDRLPASAQASEPAWNTKVWGLYAADDGSPLIVGRSPTVTGGPGVGAHLLEVGGRAVADVAALRAALDAAAAAGRVAASWKAADGTTVEGDVTAGDSPWLLERPPQGVADAFRAAWAVVASESGTQGGPSALANLALLFSSHGEHDLAARTWQRVGWPERPGIGAGTVAYYLGREYQALGRDREAVEALRRAAASEATAVTDDGPPVAPAARDRLADLGQAP